MLYQEDVIENDCIQWSASFGSEIKIQMSKNSKFESFSVSFSNQKPEKREYFIVRALL